MYHVLKAEYGQVLFERDQLQAQRILQIANFQRRSVLKQRRKNETYGMEFFSIFDKPRFSSLYLPYVNSDFDNYKRKTDPCRIFTPFRHGSH